MFVKIGTRSELPPPGEVREFRAGDRTVCVANVDGTISAMDNVCLHRGGSLGQGYAAEGKVICPWHAWAWDPATGQAGHDPNIRVAIYRVRLEGEDVLLEITPA